MEQQSDRATIRQMLILDDDPFILKTADFMLRQIGHQHIITAQHAEEALGKITSASPNVDIVFCDLNMPEMDGIEFLRQLGETRFAGGVILISGEDERTLTTAGNLASGYNLSLLGVIAKPLSVNKLKSALETWHGPRNDSAPAPDDCEPAHFTLHDLKQAI